MRNPGHREHRPWLVAVLTFALLATSTVSVRALEECQVPLFVQENGGGANLMIIADNSGSMNQAVYHDAYDPGITYTGDFDTDHEYYVSSTQMREPDDFDATWPSSPSALLVNSAPYDSARYPGNYLNWIYYHATDTQRVAIPNYTRIQVLRIVLEGIIDRAKQLDFGITIFNDSDGGNVVAPIGTDKAAVLDIVRNLRASSWTPLGETMETVLDYFTSTGAAAPIQVGCETNFCLVVTDGMPTQDVDVSMYLHDADGDGNDPGDCASIGAPYYPSSHNCSDHFDDVCYYANHYDLRPDLDDDQVLNTYVIGFNEDAPVLKDGAFNGDGLYYVADSAIDLFLSIEFAIQDILRRISSGSAVAVVSTETGTDNKLYRGKFMPLDWHGYLECYDLPYEDGDAPVWDAGYLLTNRVPSTRTIFTAVGNTELSFTEGSAGVLRTEMEDGATTLTEAQTMELINWVRGESVEGLRERNGRVLGDIIHATPVVVGRPMNFHPTEAYQTFAQNHQNRRRQVYVGANDGMLHAFDAETGYEEWAFVPQYVLPLFTVMADSGYCHRYSVDQTVTAQDIQINGTWRTILATGGGRGGGAIFVMDVTYPDNPVLLWQTHLPNKAPIHSQVQITTIRGHAVALVGSGLEESAAAKAWVWSYDLATGQYLGEMELSTVNGRNKASRPELVDQNMDNETDLLYVADMDGSVWRINVEGSADPDDWTKTKLYSGSREITTDPVAAFANDGNVFIYFGTGTYLDQTDLTTIDQQYFVCTFDRHDLNTVDLGDMADQTSSLHPVEGESGWYIRLEEADGERVTERAVVVAKEVIFTSFAPSEDVCSAGGESWLYEMRYDSGGAGGDEGDEEELRTVLPAWARA